MKPLALLALLSTFMIPQAAAFEPQALEINWYERGSRTIKEAMFRTICSKIGEPLTIKKGLWGTGIATSYTCHWRKKSKPQKFKRSRLVLDLRQETHDFSLILSYQKGSQVIPFSEINLQNSSDIPKALQKTSISRLLALSLLNQSPMAMVVDRSKLPNSPLRKIRHIKLPKTWIAFEARADQAEPLLWPQKLGTLSRIRKSDKDYLKFTSAKARDSGKTIYARVESASLVQKKIDRRLNQLLAHYDTKIIPKGQGNILFDTLDGGYMGIRYGIPLTSGDPIVAKTPMVGIFTEVMGGPLEGLRWYWDFGPETRTEVEGYTLNFTWSRPTLGWSINFDLLDEDKISIVMDITLKIGLLDLDANLLSETEFGELIPSHIRVSSAENFGIEGGLTWRTDWFLLRTWGAGDLAGIISIGDSATTISSKRAGIDSYWNLFTLGKIFEFSLLGFASFEQITIEQQDSSPELEGQSALSVLSYSTAFAGLGATLQW